MNIILKLSIFSLLIINIQKAKQHHNKSHSNNINNHNKPTQHNQQLIQPQNNQLNQSSNSQNQIQQQPLNPQAQNQFPQNMPMSPMPLPTNQIQSIPINNMQHPITNINLNNIPIATNNQNTNSNNFEIVTIKNKILNLDTEFKNWLKTIQNQFKLLFPQLYSQPNINFKKSLQLQLEKIQKINDIIALNLIYELLEKRKQLCNVCQILISTALNNNKIPSQLQANFQNYIVPLYTQIVTFTN